MEEVKNQAPEAAEDMMNEDDDIITLITDEGKELDFIEIAGIAYRGNFYAVLQPVDEKSVDGQTPPKHD